MSVTVAKYQGSRWIRAALQVNPYGYKGKAAPSGKFDDEAAYNAALLDKCEAENIELIAVTDHWCVDSAVGLISASAGRRVAVLPGFEASTSEGIHLLVIFEVGTELVQVNAAIGACGVTPGCDNGTTGRPYADIIRDMTQRGALVIPAHVNVPSSGMLTGRLGAPLEKMIKHADLHAIGITPSVSPAANQEAILLGKKPFKRAHTIAGIYADDVCHPDKLSQVGATTWFKVSSPCLAGIKHAVRIPPTRIRLTSPKATPHMIFRQISWIGGFLDGVTIRLSDDLTALIGGRGTGKSTVIESIRFVLGLEPIGENAKRDHQSVVDRVLGSGTVVRLTIEAVSPQEGEFTIQRNVRDPAVVLDASGNRTKLRPVDVIGEIELFGQHELAEVAQQKSRVARMIERISGRSEDQSASISIKAALEENRTQIEQTEARRKKLEEQLADIPRLEDAVAHFEGSGWAGRLAEKQRVNKDAAVYEDGLSRLGLVSEALGEFKGQDLITIVTNPVDGVQDSPRKAELIQVTESLAELATVLGTAIGQMEAAIAKAEVRLGASREAWAKLTDPLLDEHAEVVRTLKSEGYEPDKYLSTTKALDGLKAQAPRLDTLNGQWRSLQTERTRLLGELEKLEVSEKTALNEAIRRANASTEGSVLVKPIACPDRTHLKDVVTRRVSSQRKQLLETLDGEGFSPRSLVAAVRAGRDTLESEYGIKGAQADAIYAAGEAFLREFEEQSIGQAVDVSLDVGVGKKHEYRSLDDLSKGQKATALLLLLLAAAETPLVIDQPEDDLDNRFVFDHVVTRLRSLKGARQIIVSTHNANIPVLGDAELIVTLEGDSHSGWPTDGCTGSLDTPAVRDAAERILEGGRAAFDARRHLYGI